MLRLRHKDDKAAHRAWERCTPVIPRQKLVLRYGGVEMFTPVKEIDAMGGGKRTVGRDGLIVPENALGAMLDPVEQGARVPQRQETMNTSRHSGRKRRLYLVSRAEIGRCWSKQGNQRGC